MNLYAVGVMIVDSRTRYTGYYLHCGTLPYQSVELAFPFSTIVIFLQTDFYVS